MRVRSYLIEMLRRHRATIALAPIDEPLTVAAQAPLDASTVKDDAALVPAAKRPGKGPRRARKGPR